MKKYLAAIFISLLLLIAVSCKKYDLNGKEIIYKELYRANWILGEWQKTDSIGTLTESWKTENDSTFVGTSFYIINKDTIHSESLELMEDTEHLIYTATVIGQNDDQPIPFQMTEITDSLIIFKNPKHDFPNAIKYKLNKDATITATVSGTSNGKISTEDYLMTKK